MNLFLCAGGGFLVAVLWMDLMFDVLSFAREERAAGRQDEVPEQALAQIAGYYRRVTTTAAPMNRLIGAVMAAMVAVLALRLVRADEARWVASASLALCGVPITLVLLRVFPNAMRLGSRVDPAAEQSRLARAIRGDHLLCLAAMLGFLALRFLAGN